MYPRRKPQRGAAGTSPRNQIRPAATRYGGIFAAANSNRAGLRQQDGTAPAGGGAQPSGQARQGRRSVPPPAQSGRAGVGPAGAPLSCQ